jgi:hypothetical protein
VGELPSDLDRIPTINDILILKMSTKTTFLYRPHLEQDWAERRIALTMRAIIASPDRNNIRDLVPLFQCRLSTPFLHEGMADGNHYRLSQQFDRVTYAPVARVIEKVLGGDRQAFVFPSDAGAARSPNLKPYGFYRTPTPTRAAVG